jgi:hypothetical protein
MDGTDGRECYHCRQWIAAGEVHDCWTTTEAALTRGLDDDLREAYERVREAAVDLGDQRIYASHHSIMFARRVCYAFVRPRRRWLDVCIFLGREITGPQVRRSDRVSRTKVANLLRVTHRDEVEAPITDWLAEAYAYVDSTPAPAPTEARVRRAARKR